MSFLKKTFIMIIFSWLSLSVQANEYVQWLNDVTAFARGGIKNFGAVGTVFPLSRYMAATMIRHIEEQIEWRKQNNNHDTVRILEVGAGNGALSEYFVRWIAKNSVDCTLDLVEIDPEFQKILVKKFGNSSFVSVAEPIDICKFKSEHPYDIVISTLPFNSKIFNPTMVADILAQFTQLTCHGGLLLQVEYAVVGNATTCFLTSKEAQNYRKKHRKLDTFRRLHPTNKEIVMLNVPPTWLYVTRINRQLNNCIK